MTQKPMCPQTAPPQVTAATSEVLVRLEASLGELLAGLGPGSAAAATSAAAAATTAAAPADRAPGAVPASYDGPGGLPSGSAGLNTTTTSGGGATGVGTQRLVSRLLVTTTDLRRALRTAEVAARREQVTRRPCPFTIR